jgi:hypothetical protein
LVQKKLHLIESSIAETERADDPDWVALKALCVQDWQEIAQSLESMNLGSASEILIVDAMEDLPAVDYMSFLEALGAQYVDGVLSTPVMVAALHPKGRFGAFLIDNWQHARVTIFLGSVKAKLPADHAQIAVIESILDGSAKASWTEYREAHTAEILPPVIVLP